MQKFYIIASGIKSTKTRKRLGKVLGHPFGDVNGGPERVWTDAYAHNPAEALSTVLRALTSFTPDHLSNLTWTVTTVDPFAPVAEDYRRKIISYNFTGEQDVLVELEPGQWYYEGIEYNDMGPLSPPHANPDYETERELVLA